MQKEKFKDSKAEILSLGQTWLFKPDPDGIGEKEEWFSPKYKDGSWKPIKASQKGWRGQGLPEYCGYGWERQQITIPAKFTKFRHLYLVFGGVDVTSVVYVNGQKAFVHDSETTGFPFGAHWNKPFSFDAKQFLVPEEDNLIAVRAKNGIGPGGVWRPAFIIATSQEADTPTLYEFLVTKGKAEKLDFGKWYFKLPPLPKHPHEELLGSRIQRTMTLLATSTPEVPRPVRILFYGQSITAGIHWQKLMDRLRKRYPNANIIAENRAIGGYQAPNLVRTATQGLYPFYPDLVIFHVYGGEITGELERIISNIRRYTTAEIMLYTHHVCWKTNDEKLMSKRMNMEHECAGSEFVHYLGQKYNCEIVEVRKEWINYLKTYNIKPNELIGDTVHSDVHPNLKGHTLLAELIYRHFRYNSLFPCGWYDQVRTYEARRPLEEKNDEITFTGKPWKSDARHGGATGVSSDSALKLAFVGNRVDVVAFDCPNPGSARILIDGQPPSNFRGSYAVTGISKVLPGRPWPAIKRISLGVNPLAEEWILRLTKVSDDAENFTFEVVGSITGPDGIGNNKKIFVSNSGRIIIEPEDFTFAGVMKYRKKPYPVGYEITWRVIPMFVDVWKPKRIKKPAVEKQYTLVQGLTNQKHTLEIVPRGDGKVPIKSVLIYHPPLTPLGR